MHWSDAEPHLTLGFATPPYHEITRPPTPAAGRLPRGTLLVLEIRSLSEGWRLVPDAVAAARRLYPAAPVILRVPEITPEMLRLAHRASRMGVRAIVGRGEALAVVLRPVLTRPDDLAADLMEWMGLRDALPPSGLSGMVRVVVEMAPRYARVSDLLRAMGHSERTVRHRFHATGHPGPREWHQGARALHAALRLQQDPDGRLLPLAVELGYSDHSGITRQLTRAFGVTPAAIRGTLGWEWLAERWLTRVSVRRTKPAPKPARARG
jgi:AraC-like DNA-binding protein